MAGSLFVDVFIFNISDLSFVLSVGNNFGVGWATSAGQLLKFHQRIDVKRITEDDFSH